MLENVLAPENPNGTVAASHWIFCMHYCPERKHCKECKDLIGWFDSCEKYRCYADAARANAGDPEKEPKSLRQFLYDILKQTNIVMVCEHTGEKPCKYLVKLYASETAMQPVYQQYTNGTLGLETALECLAADLDLDIHEAVKVRHKFHPKRVALDCCGMVTYATSSLYDGFLYHRIEE